MPYKIVQVKKNPPLFKVKINKPGRPHYMSKHGLTYENAVRQMHAIHMHMEGGDAEEQQEPQEPQDGMTQEELKEHQQQILANLPTTASVSSSTPGAFSTGLSYLQNVPEIGKLVPIAEKIADVTLGVFGSHPKTLASARAAEAGIDIFNDTQYIIGNKNYPVGDDRRYEISYNAGAKYGPPYSTDPRYTTIITKADQDRYLTYQKYIAFFRPKYGYNIQKWVPFLSPKEYNYLFPTDQHSIDAMSALTKIHGH